MKNVLVLTHGDFAEGIISSVRVICGSDMGIRSICVKVEDSLETVSDKIRQFVDGCPAEEEKVIITDIPGGSTTSAAIHFVNDDNKVYVITGLNLGMLLEIVLNQEEDVVNVITTIVENAKQTILFLNSMMPK